MGRVKRILIVVASLTGGGAERVAAVWADGLARRGHKVTVLTDMSRPVTYRPSEQVKLATFGLPKKPTGRGLRRWLWAALSRLRVAMRLWRIVREEETDVIVDVGYQYGCEVLAVGRLAGVKLLQTDHNACTRPADMPMTLRDKLRKFLMTRLYDGVTVLTEADRKEMARRGIKKAVVLHNALALNIGRGAVDRDRTVVAVGRPGAMRVKGIDMLLDVWKGISDRHRDWRLRIVGCTVDETQWERVESVPFKADIAEEYRRASVFVMPSRCEGWGLVAVEAMSQGCAVVVCDFEGRQREYVTDGVNGVVCRAGDAVELENAIERVICDEGLRRRLQSDAAAGLERFAPDVVAGNLERIIYRLCGESVS